jgi:predicted nucleic acid-binding protein
MVLSKQIKKIFIDTAPIIYYVEADAVWGPIVKKIIDTALLNKVRFVSSVVTLSEVLVKPYSESDELLQARFKQLLCAGKNLTLLEITTDIAELAAKFRGIYPTLKGMDSLQLAAAISSDSDVFLTNDRKLRNISEIKVMLLEDYQKEQN